MTLVGPQIKVIIVHNQEKLTNFEQQKQITRAKQQHSLRNLEWYFLRYLYRRCIKLGADNEHLSRLPLPVSMPSPREAGIQKVYSKKERSSCGKWYPHTAQRTADAQGAWKISRRLPY